MDEKEIFDALVRKATQADLDDYYSREFSFETCFSVYSYSYCCCPCSFEREFLDYLQEDGINETMFDRIKENIARGKCMHVDGVVSQYVYETTVTGQHIVAASGVLPLEHCESATTIFRLYPYMITVFKKHNLVVEKYIQYCYNKSKEGGCVTSLNTRLLYASRSIENPEFIEMRSKQITELCADQNDPLLFIYLDPECLENFDEHLSRIFEILYQNKSSDMLKRLCDFIRSNACSCNIGRCLQSIIIHDEPEILADSISYTPSCSYDRDLNDLKEMVSKTCHFFHRGKCANVLKNANLLLEEVTFDYECFEKNDLLDRATISLNDCPKKLSTTIATILKKDPIVLDIIHDKLRVGSLNKLTALKASVENGCDLNSLEPRSQTVWEQEVELKGRLYAPLVSFDFRTPSDSPIEADLSNINGALSYHDSRETLEMLIYENADISWNKKCVVKAIEVDEILVECELFLDRWGKYSYAGIHDIGYCGAYMMNGLEHSPYGHEGKSFALNFAAPLLFECGYPVDNESLHKALDKKMHNEELEYFRRYMNNPKSLQFSCCIALRTKFKGRAIHGFVVAANLPKTIADLVLFKHVLKCV